jgi:hypothetical protein
LCFCLQVLHPQPPLREQRPEFGSPFLKFFCVIWGCRCTATATITTQRSLLVSSCGTLPTTSLSEQQHLVLFPFPFLFCKFTQSDTELLLCVCWVDKVVLLVHCCVLQISCIQGTPLSPVSCRKLWCFAISAMGVDRTDTYPAGAVVNFQPSGGSVVPAKIALATGAGAPCHAPCQACSQSCQTSCQTPNQECSQTCCPGGSQGCSPACSWRAHGPC